MVSSDLKTEPYKSVLLEGTEANYNMYGGYSVFTPDTSQTGIKPGLLVHLTESGSGNAVSLCDAFYGDAVKGESDIGIVEIPASYPKFAKAYDKATAFTAATDSFKVHWLRPGDKVWVKSEALNADVKAILIPAANGLVALMVGTTTIDKYNVHAFRPLRSDTSKTWHQVEYIGRISVDSS
jgi:hypothetical protein